jgi:hypothetical protein
LLLLGSFRKIDLRDEAPMFLLGITAFIIPLSSIFLFWYVNVSLPAIALFIARRLDETGSIILAGTIICSIMAACLLIFFSIPYFHNDTGVRDVAAFMKGKTVYYVETPLVTRPWSHLAKYSDTRYSYILLEQYAPGLLYYRFNESADYENLIPVFFHGRDSVPCAEYLVVRKPHIYETLYSPSVPSCYTLLWESEHFAAYTDRSAIDS